MNLASTLFILAGGPGSGCQGPNCGRKEVYHGTSGAVAQAILRKGILPSAGEAWVTTDKDEAVDYGRMGKETTNAIGAVIVIDRDKFEQAGNRFRTKEGSVEPGNWENEGFYHNVAIHPSFISRIELYKKEDMAKTRQQGQHHGSFPGIKPFSVLKGKV